MTYELITRETGNTVAFYDSIEEAAEACKDIDAEAREASVLVWFDKDGVAALFVSLDF